MNFVPKSEIRTSKFEIGIEILLILLIIFTPIAFGSQVLWAFSLMELGILLIMILWAVQRLGYRPPVTIPRNDLESEIHIPKSEIPNPQSEILCLQSEIHIPKSEIPLTIFLLSLFLGIVLLQMIPLPEGIIKIISPKTYELRNQLTVSTPIADTAARISTHESRPTAHDSRLTTSEIRNPKSQIGNPQSELRISKSEIPNPPSQIRNPKSEIPNPKSEIRNPQSLITTLSFFPLATKVEFLKWLALGGLFMFLLHWRLSDNGYRITHHLIIAIFLVGIFESLYGIFEFFSGHRHILNLDWSSQMSSVTGTFANRNCFAGYLLMVIPLSIGFLFSRETHRSGRLKDWRHRLSSLDGKTLLIGFGLILMILALLLSASRGGIISLLISFSFILLLFRDPTRGEKFSRAPAVIFGLAVLWAAWIGLDAVISRFFSAPEAFAAGRWSRWIVTLGILKDFPLLGSGLGTFTEVYSMYRTMHIVGLDIQTENDFLQLASEVGLVGTIPLLILFLFLFFKAASGIRSLSHGQPQRYIGIGGLVGILALMFHSIVQKNLQLPANAFLYTVMWAMVLRIALDPCLKRIAGREAPEN